MNLTKETLSKFYLEDKLSTRECGKIFGISQPVICRKLKEFGIKARAYTENKMPTKKGECLSTEHKEAISSAMTDNPNNWMKGKILSNHPNWKGGVRTYRRMKLSEVPLECSLCEQKEIVKKKTNLIVHHIDGNRNNNSLENLQVLCDSCHKKLHNQSK